MEENQRGVEMQLALKSLKPGILLAVSAAVLAGLAFAVKRASDFDMDFDLDWEDMPA